MAGRAPWWKSAVVYQIYPRSFRDTTGNGIGDLEGVRRGLDHLSWLGVDAIWLSPFYPSPMKDFGYDVADYCDVDPLFGTLEDFDRLVSDAHQRRMRVLIDWVPNHTSDQHPWFAASRQSRQSPKRDWYWWRDDRPDEAGGTGPPGSPGRRPNNWRAAFGGPAWTWDPGTGQWYLHLFLPEQPDLNWANSGVVSAMHDVLRFWLARGVDGFRIDVVHGLWKDPVLADLPADQEARSPSSLNDQPGTHDLIRGFRSVLEEYPGERMMVGEVYLLSTAKVAEYYGSPERPELHLAFNFPPLYAPWEAGAWRHRVDRVVEEIDRRQGWPTWVLSNHDNPRHRSRYGTAARARASAVLLLTLRGTPFLYAGEELGLEDAVIPDDRRVDPAGRDGCRAPVPWDGAPDHGWTGQLPPWLPFPPDADRLNVAAERSDVASTLHLYRRLLAARRASPALQLGLWEPLVTSPGVLGYLRVGPGRASRRAVYINFTHEPVKVAGSAEPWMVEVSSDAGGQAEGTEWTGTLGPDEAVLLRPAG